MKKRKHSGYYFIPIIALFLMLAGCDGGRTGNGIQTSSIGVKFSFDPNSSKMLNAVVGGGGGGVAGQGVAAGTINDINSIQITVVNHDDTTDVIGTLILDGDDETPDNVWTGTLENLPIGMALDFSATAYNSSGHAIFKDDGINTNVTLGVASTNMTFVMEVLYKSPSDLPSIVEANVPTQILKGASGVQFSFLIEHPSAVEYIIEAEEGTITSPVPGTWRSYTPTGNPIIVMYNAPSVPTQETITFKVRTPGNDDESIGTVRFPEIVDTLPAAGMLLQFSPTITNIEILHAETELWILPEVTSDNGPLTFMWEGTGIFSDISDPSSETLKQPLSIDVYNDRITLTVTDASGIPTLYSRTISNVPFPATKFEAKGTLNTDIANNGILAESNFPVKSQDMTIDSNGRILITGAYDNGTNTDMFIIRYNSDGSIDTTFGTNGIVTHDKGARGTDSSDDIGKSIVVNSSGKIFVAGHSVFSNTEGTDMILWCYNEDGSLDTGFGANSNGFVSHHNAAGGNLSDMGNAIGLDSNGNILVTGKSQNDRGEYGMVIWKYLSNGIIDSSFGNNGVVTDFNNSHTVGNAITIDSNGNILITGAYLYSTPLNFDGVIWRYTSNGTLDENFSANGGKIVFWGDAGKDGNENGYSIMIDNDGKIIVASQGENEDGNYDIVVYRYLNNGEKDSNFGNHEEGGIILHNNAAGGNGHDIPYSLAIDKNGKILIAGKSQNADGNYDMTVWRYDNDGMIDSDFGNDGIFIHHNAAEGNGNDTANSIYIGPTDNIIVVGNSQKPDSSSTSTIWWLK